MVEKTLNNLLPLQCGTVKKVTATGKLKQRLFDMGITTGTRIVLKKTAPLGDPIEITIRDYELSLRLAEATAIILEVEETTV
ncbi:MAG: ferrous iron transport protein A [Christensenellaceae bacterium]|jgi:Fe2+ transport system protein FeoA|nr:ferrous iron transport protein A [Christensenellaceae bacterium]